MTWIALGLIIAGYLIGVAIENAGNKIAKAIERSKTNARQDTRDV